jgi:hypothetical protein
MVVITDAEATGGVSVHAQHLFRTCRSQSQLWAPDGWHGLMSKTAKVPQVVAYIAADFLVVRAPSCVRKC